MAEAKLSAGGGTFVTSEGFRDYYAFKKKWLNKTVSSIEAAFLMTITGNSMEPTISNRDIVMIDTGRHHIYKGNLYAISMEDTVMIKRLSLRPEDKIKYRLFQTTEKSTNHTKATGKISMS